MTIDTDKMREAFPLWTEATHYEGCEYVYKTFAIHALCTEVERLKREGFPGVMHEVDRAFYKLTIKERDYERQKAFRLEQEREAAEARAERLARLVRRNANNLRQAGYSPVRGSNNPLESWLWKAYSVLNSVEG